LKWEDYSWPVDPDNPYLSSDNPFAVDAPSDSTDKDSMAEKADAVIKGILDRSLSRSKVREVGDAVKNREKSDQGSGAIGRAINTPHRPMGGFWGFRG
jgi:hypothetical protein